MFLSLLRQFEPEVAGGFLPILLTHRICQLRIDKLAKEFLGGGVRDGQAGALTQIRLQ
jgi:hypothetical protein